jgi:hypothetical protein
VVEEPQPLMPQVQKAKGLLKSKGKEAAKVAAAAAEAQAAASLRALVLIKQLDGMEVKTTCQQVSMVFFGPSLVGGLHPTMTPTNQFSAPRHTNTIHAPQVALSGDVPVGIHGGPLLGVSYARQTTSGSELSGEDASAVLQLWSWDGRTKVGLRQVAPYLAALTHMGGSSFCSIQ